MSEHIRNREERKEQLKRLIRLLHEGRTVDEVKEEFAALLRDVGPKEVAEIEQALIDEGLPEMEIKRLCDVHALVFRESLEVQKHPESLPGHPIHTCRAENKAAAKVLDKLEAAIEALRAAPDEVHTAGAWEQLQRVQEYERHYLRKENILFPYLERHGFTGPSAVMWAIHDDVRAWWKELDNLLAAGPGDDPEGLVARVEEVFSQMAHAVREMFFKEEQILFPTSLDLLTPEEWLEVRAQEPEIGYAYVEPGDRWPPAGAELPKPTPPKAAEPPKEATVKGLLPLEVGALTPKQLNLLLNHLPVEISFVDAEDTVRYFNRAQERIFHRTPAVIGRKVQKCHPPASVHRVQRILDDFRDGRRDVAEFWIQMQDRFIHIRYFAVRDEKGEYQGTLEVVQDVTGIRALEGERRLLDEEE